MSKQEFLDGFDFCLKLLVGDAPPPSDLIENLRRVASGELSLLPTYSEFRLTVERLEAIMREGEKVERRGRYAALKDDVVRKFSEGRREADAENVKNALLIMQVYGIPAATSRRRTA